MCIEAIEQYTHTIIQFPTINTNGYGRRTSVIITGSPAQVCQARKLFDVKFLENYPNVQLEAFVLMKSTEVQEKSGPAKFW